MSRNPFGFTMVELMIVVFVLGIVAAVAIPSINSSLDEMKLDSAAREIVSAIQYSQSLAIKKGIEYGVKFDKTTQTVTCYKKQGSETILHPIEKKPYILDFSGSENLQGVELDVTTFVGNKVEFNDLGEPSQSGSVTVECADLQKTINISLPIGKVSVN